MHNQKIVFIFATSKTNKTKQKNIMNYSIHHTVAFTNILRSTENYSLSLEAQLGDFMYRKKWEYHKDIIQ